jgi:DNA polymerase-3 subunit epsilon
MSLDFVAIDVETANFDRGSICSFGWAEVRNGKVVRTDSRLCRPPEELDWFAPFNTSIHGLTESDVISQPRFDELVPDLMNSFGDLPFVAHNAAFDIGALRHAYSSSGLPWPSLSYGCTMVWSRRLLDLPSHRLPVVCDFLELPLEHHHDAGCDATAAAHIALTLARRVEASSVEELADATHCALGRLLPNQWSGCRVRSSTSGDSSRPVAPPANLDANPENPFYGRNVVLTLGLSCMFRKVAVECIAEAGGTCRNEVTNKSSILIIGGGFKGESLNEFRDPTNKMKDALEKRAAGQPIEIWTEADFTNALMVADVAPWTTEIDGQKIVTSVRTLFAAVPREGWENPETYPGISSAYWRWFEAHLSGGSRANKGEPCRICHEPIARNAHWKFRDRHVCSSECNYKIKRRFKSAVTRGEIADFDYESEYDDDAESMLVVDLDEPSGHPRLFVVVHNSPHRLN